jgi:hypothetical protein
MKKNIDLVKQQSDLLWKRIFKIGLKKVKDNLIKFYGDYSRCF